MAANPKQPGFGSKSIASYFMNGLRSDFNNPQIDGSRNLDTFGGNAFVTPNLHAMSEFRVENNSYDASTGRTGGGQINLISRSGTNKFHGNVFVRKIATTISGTMSGGLSRRISSSFSGPKNGGESSRAGEHGPLWSPRPSSVTASSPAKR